MGSLSAGKLIIVVDGAEYSIDSGNLTFRELDLIERRTGKPMGVAFQERNASAMVALAEIAMKRDGIKADYEKLLDMPVGAIDIKDDPTEAEQSAANGTPPSPESTE